MEVIGAIADPVRRDILMLLRAGPRTAGTIASAFAISRPAVSRHLRVLRESGLVHDEARGRQRVYRLDLAALAPLDAWLAQLRTARTDGTGWGGRLDALETEVYRTRRDRRRGGPPASTESIHESSKERPA
jgi:DNA-binding transcriptional ArsR family regulator